MAKQNLEYKIKEQQKAIRREVKSLVTPNFYQIEVFLLKKLFQRRGENRPSTYVFPLDVEDIPSNVTKQIIELPTHSVTVTSLADLELVQKDLFLGKNAVRHFTRVLFVFDVCLNLCVQGILKKVTKDSNAEAESGKAGTSWNSNAPEEEESSVLPVSADPKK